MAYYLWVIASVVGTGRAVTAGGVFGEVVEGIGVVATTVV